jgi:DNA-binding GntR family transcriptional regulator
MSPGKKLKIADLCQSMNVSLSAVREALSRLTAEGLVTAEPQRGFRAAPVAEEDLKGLQSARVEIESLCLKSAIQLGGIAWETEIVAAQHRLRLTEARLADDPRGPMSREWSDAHANFHRALVSACDNPWLLRIRESLYAQSERYRWFALRSDKQRNVPAEHDSIVSAALSRNAGLASELMAEHIRMTTRVVLGDGFEREVAAAVGD